MAAALLAVGDWIAVARGARAVEFICKPGALLALALAAATLAVPDPQVRAWFVLALVFSVIGDVFLMLPRDLFMSGLAAFLLGHLAYIAGFASGQGRGCSLLPAACRLTSPGVVRGVVLAAFTALILVLGLPLLGRILGGASRARLPRIVPAIGAYTAVISVMLASAMLSGNIVAAGGALLFYVSDSLIGWTRFVGSIPQSRLIIISTYHVGQGLLVLSLLGRL